MSSLAEKCSRIHKKKYQKRQKFTKAFFSRKYFINSPSGVRFQEFHQKLLGNSGNDFWIPCSLKCDLRFFFWLLAFYQMFQRSTSPNFHSLHHKFLLTLNLELIQAIDSRNAVDSCKSPLKIFREFKHFYQRLSEEFLLEIVPGIRWAFVCFF